MKIKDMRELKEKLKQLYLGDYVLFLDSFGTIKYYIYGNFELAKQHYKRIQNSLIGDDLNNKYWVEELV